MEIEYVPTMLQRLQTAFAHVAINTKKAREYIKRQADKKARQRLLMKEILYFYMIPA